MHPKAIENILNLKPFDRYQYFIRKIADWEKVYTLVFLNGNYAMSIVDDKKLFPLWSAREFAELSKTGDWQECEILELDFNELEKLFDYIGEYNFLINVFPTDTTGFVVTLEEFSRDLGTELEQY